MLAFGLLAAGQTQAAIPASERAVLDDFYSGTQGEHWTDNTGWEGSAGTECQWFGIDCSAGEEHVTGMTLTQNNLVGPFPEIASLTKLQAIDVAINQLAGPIPTLNTLADLRFFDAFANQLSGSIPDLAGLHQLAEFDVSLNRLSGPIPDLAGLGQLAFFDVMDNRLSGAVPALTGLTQLHFFQIGGNRLSGAVPDPPLPNILAPGGSRLCTGLGPDANLFAATPSATWDTATGRTPWFLDCNTESIFADGYDE
jgi:hypothetical protein